MPGLSQKSTKNNKFLEWLKKRIKCSCICDIDADGESDLEVGWNGEDVNYSVDVTVKK